MANTDGRTVFFRFLGQKDKLIFDIGALIFVVEKNVALGKG